MIALIENRRDKIAALCRQFRIKRPDVFGLAATGAFNPETSEIDFLVDLGGYEPGVSDRYLDFANALEELLGYDVELVTDNSIRNPIFRRALDRDREPVYERASDQAVA